MMIGSSGQIGEHQQGRNGSISHPESQSRSSSTNNFLGLVVPVGGVTNPQGSHSTNESNFQGFRIQIESTYKGIQKLPGSIIANKREKKEEDRIESFGLAKKALKDPGNKPNPRMSAIY